MCLHLPQITAPRRACVAIVGLLLVLLAGASADSPVTSTPFHEAYLDYGIVREAKDSGVVTEEIARYLARESNPLDVRAAVINALGWDVDGKNNAEGFCRLRYKDAQGIPDPERLRGHEAFVIGYLMLMDDYFSPAKALPMLDRARELLPESFTVAMVCALARAQEAMDQHDRWPEMWTMTEEVVDSVELNGDMRLGAVRIITDYMGLYRAEGPGE